MNRLVVHLGRRQLVATTVVLVLLVAAAATIARDKVGGVAWLAYLAVAPAALIATLFRFVQLREDGEWLQLAQLEPRHSWLGPVLASALVWIAAASFVRGVPAPDTGLRGVLSMSAGGGQTAWSGHGFVLSGVRGERQVLHRYGQRPQRTRALEFERVSASEFREVATGESFRFRPHSPTRRARLTLAETAPLEAMLAWSDARLPISHLLYAALVIVLPLLLHRQARRFDVFTGGRLELALVALPALFALAGVLALCEAMWTGALTPTSTVAVAGVLLVATSS